MTGRRAVAIAVAIAAVAAVILLIGRDGEDAPRGAATAAGAAATAAAPAVPPGAAGGATARTTTPVLAAAPVTPYPELGAEGLSTDDPLTAYRRANVYPPTSRPLTTGHVNLLHPNRRHETEREVEADDGVAYLFTADRYFVIGDEALTSTLTVTRGGAPVRATITEAAVVVLAAATGGAGERRVPVAFEPSATGAALVNRFAPATLPDLRRQTALSIAIEFDYGGTARQRAQFDFQYTPQAGVPARFTGAFTDSIVDGSLVIRAGVAVTQEGRYVIDCNLYDAADAPVAWTRFKGQLTAGAQTADLVFFGKVLVDGGARGAFHIGQLRGARFVPGADPDLEQMAPFTGSYTTRAYEPSELSPAEWDSPQKQKMIQFLTEQAARGVHQGAASGGR